MLDDLPIQTFIAENIKDSGFKIEKLARFPFFDGMKYHRKYFCENGKYGFSDHYITVFNENYFDGMYTMV